MGVETSLKDLEALATTRPDLAEELTRLTYLVSTVFNFDKVTRPTWRIPKEDELRDGWTNGTPAFLVGEAPPTLTEVDAWFFASFLIGKFGWPGTKPNFSSDPDPEENPRFPLGSWGALALIGDYATLDRKIEESGLHRDIVLPVLRLIALKRLALCSKVLSEMRPEGLWNRGNCPNCGSLPALGEWRGVEAVRVWRCGVCAAEWPGDRFRCPACRESDPHRILCCSIEGISDRYRRFRCTSCGVRIPLIPTLLPLSVASLLVVELAARSTRGDDAELDDTEVDLHTWSRRMIGLTRAEVEAKLGPPEKRKRKYGEPVVEQLRHYRIPPQATVSLLYDEEQVVQADLEFLPW